MKKHLLALVCILAATFVWGITAIIIKTSLNFSSPMMLIFSRLFVATLVVTPFIVKKWEEMKKVNIKMSQLITLAILGQGLYLIFVFYGFNNTSAVAGTTIASLTPIFTVILSVIILKEKIKRKEAIFITSAIVFGIIFSLSPLFMGKSHDSHLLGNILLLISALLWSSFSIYSKELFKQNNPFYLTALIFPIGLLFCTPFAMWEYFFADGYYIISRVWMYSLFLGSLSSVFAVFAFEKAISILPAHLISLFDNLTPVYAIPLAIWILKERPTNLELICSLLILISIILAVKFSEEKRRYHHRKHD